MSALTGRQRNKLKNAMAARQAERDMPLGTGQRFAALESSLKAKGARDPAALAAYIGRKKYGKKKFQNLSK